VTPQIAAGLSLVDPNFVTEAKQRLASLAGLAPVPEERRQKQRSRIEAYARVLGASGERLLAALHSAQGPDSSATRDKKAMQALIALLEEVPAQAIEGREDLLEAARRNVLPVSEDFSALTRKWRDSFRAAWAEARQLKQG
jgi:hypothetical protein